MLLFLHYSCLALPTEDCFDFDSVFFPSFSEVGIVIYTTGGLGTGVCILVKLKPIKLWYNESESVAQHTLMMSASYYLLKFHAK